MHTYLAVFATKSRTTWDLMTRCLFGVRRQLRSGRSFVESWQWRTSGQELLAGIRYILNYGLYLHETSVKILPLEISSTEHHIGDAWKVPDPDHQPCSYSMVQWLTWNINPPCWWGQRTSEHGKFHQKLRDINKHHDIPLPSLLSLANEVVLEQTGQLALTERDYMLIHAPGTHMHKRR